MQASIIIPTKDRESILLESLSHAIQAIDGAGVEIIIVNDGEKDIAVPSGWQARIEVVRNPKKGVASARNFGAKHASSSLLIFMDDDMLIHKAALEKLIRLSHTHPSATININWIYPPALLSELLKSKFGRYLHKHGFTSLKGWNTGQPWNDEELFENIGITSQLVAIPKELFFSVDGYDESFPHAGFEDYDFAKRLKNKGARFYIWPKDTVYHNETDRHDLRKWLQRKERGGETRKHAVTRGNTELALHYSGIKKFILQVLASTGNSWIRLLEYFPNTPLLDSVYGKLVNILLATSIFKGYTTGTQK